MPAHYGWGDICSNKCFALAAAILPVIAELVPFHSQKYRPGEPLQGRVRMRTKLVIRKCGHEAQPDVAVKLSPLSHRHSLWGREGGEDGWTWKPPADGLIFLLLHEIPFSSTGLRWLVHLTLREQFQLASHALWWVHRRASINVSSWSLPVFLLAPQMGQKDLYPQELHTTGLTYLGVFSLL